MRRHGSVLIISIGLLAVLLALGMAFLARMRLSADESLHIVREGQARIMLQSACHYLMESSRMGWAPPLLGLNASDDEAATLMATCGWTDIRDGSLGPRPVPLPAGTPQPSWWSASWPPYNSAVPPVPPPIWWTYAKPYNLAPRAWDGAGADDNLPPAGLRRWPCPGSVVRIDAYRVERPRYAVIPAYTLNPVLMPVAPAPATSAIEPYPGGVAALKLNDEWGGGTPIWAEFYYRTLDSVIGRSGGGAIQGTGKGALDPQPISDTYSQFAAGDATPVPSSMNLAWFRIYRETMADHDNIPVAANDPDRVPLRGYNTFIIACGAGSSRGFRFWGDESEYLARPEIEPVTASASGLFPDKAFFEQQRSVERIVWFRVEWSGYQGGNFDSVYAYQAMGGIRGYGWNGELFMYGRGQAENDRGKDNESHLMLQHLNGVGHIAWLQRLENEPPRW